MATKDLDFHNHIYLFNDPNQVVLSHQVGDLGNEDVDEQQAEFQKKMKAGLFFSAYNGVVGAASVSEFLGDQGTGLEANIFNEKGFYGDVPIFASQLDFTQDLRAEYGPAEPDTPVEDTESVYPEGISISTNLSTHPDFLFYFRSVNDIALSPFNRHKFNIINGNMIKYEYQKLSDLFQKPKFHTGYSLSLARIQLGQKGIEEAKNLAKVLTQGSDAPITVGIANNLDRPGFYYNNFLKGFSDDYSLRPYENPYGNNFTYIQDFYLTIYTSQDINPKFLDAEYITEELLQDEDPNAKVIEDGTHFEEVVQTYFRQLANGTGQGQGSENSINSPRRLVLDAATKIGVPYDIHTVIENSADLQNYGIRNTTPQYRSVYNYYDLQYEPGVVSAVNSNVVGENALPSIYDFLYLPKQFNTLSTFLHVNENLSLENFNLSNLDNYLNAVSELYIKYAEDVSQDNPSEVPGTEDLTLQFPEKNLFDFNELIDVSTISTDAKMDMAYYSPFSYIFDTNKNKFIKEVALNLDFSKNAKKSKFEFIPKWLEQVKRGIYFSEKSIQTFNQAEQFKNNFPFLMEIDIPTEQMGPIAKLLSQTDLLDSINTHAASLTTPLDSSDEFGLFDNLPDFNRDGVDYVGPETVGSYYGGLINGNNDELFNLFEEVKLKTFRMYFTNSPQNEVEDDPFKYSQSQVSSVQGQNVLGLKAFIGPMDIFIDNFSTTGLQFSKNVFTYTENEYKGGWNQKPDVFTNILQYMQANKFVNSMKKLFIDGKLLRTPAEIQQGKLAHQETLMYEIAKYDGSNNYIQSVFIPISELNNINYLDTQVVPYKNYYYKIFAHKVVVGTKYRMAPFIQNDENEYIEAVITNQNLYRHQYWVQPYLQFVRVPYYNAPMVNVTTDKLNLSRVEDLPPLAPQVQIVPYKGVNNKILFLFNSSTGQVLEKPLPVFDSDISTFEAIAISQQKMISEDGLISEEILFGGDDPLDSVQIFREENPIDTENKGRPYKDISNSVTLFVDSAFSEEASAASYVDTIKPNKDYYYFFRAIDIHGKLSNPTQVYKVRMISDVNSAPYLKVELYTSKGTSEIMDSTKTFQRYLLLEPSSKQNVVEYTNLTTDVNDLALGNYETQNIKLGPEADSVFGNKYKLRITSKQTGRKIDVNVTVKEPKNIINDI